MKATMLWLLAMVPGAVVLGLSGIHRAPRVDGSWIHMSHLVGFFSALIGVPTGLIFVGLHAIRASPRRTRLCMFALLVNAAAFSLLLWAASIEFVSIVSRTEAGVSLFFSVAPAAMAALLALRLDSTRRKVGSD